jgi:hypothetical protein
MDAILLAILQDKLDEDAKISKLQKVGIKNLRDLITERPIQQYQLA